MACFDLTFGWLERMKMNPTAVTQSLISFSAVLQKDDNSVLEVSSFQVSSLTSFHTCPLPHHMQLFGKRQQMTSFVSRILPEFKILCMQWNKIRPPLCVALHSFWWMNKSLVLVLTCMVWRPFHCKINWTTTLGHIQLLCTAGFPSLDYWHGSFNSRSFVTFLLQSCPSEICCV